MAMDDDGSALAVADRLRPACLAIAGASVRSVILHGSRDPDLLAVAKALRDLRGDPNAEISEDGIREVLEAGSASC